MDVVVLANFLREKGKNRFPDPILYKLFPALALSFVQAYWLKSVILIALKIKLLLLNMPALSGASVSPGSLKLKNLE